MNKKQRKAHLSNIAALGGKASMKKLTKQQRIDKARKAARIRWSEGWKTHPEACFLEIED